MNNLKVCLIFFLSAWTFHNLNAQGSIVWQDSSLVFDFGDIDYGQDYLHDFVFTNQTIDTLHIETIRTDCGCTVPNWEDTFIAPMSEGKISVTYTPKKHGYFSEKVRVFFYEQKKSFILSVEGYVFKE
jgi:hypothetical protein